MEQKDINESTASFEPSTESSIGETQVSYSIKDFVKMVAKHWIGFVLCGLMGLAAGVVYCRYIQQPKYQAKSTVYVLKKADKDEAEAITYAKNMARLASMYMAQDEVKEQACKLLTGVDTYTEYSPYNIYPTFKDTSTGETKYATSMLGGYYTVTLEQFSNSDTSIFIHVTSTTKDPELSIDVANAVVYATKMLTENSNSSGVANILSGYINPLSIANSANNTATRATVLGTIGGLLGVIVGIAYGILREMLNTRVSTKKELEIITGVKVIGMIPNYIEKEPEESELELDDLNIKSRSPKKGGN